MHSLKQRVSLACAYFAHLFIAHSLVAAEKCSIEKRTRVEQISTSIVLSVKSDKMTTIVLSVKRDEMTSDTDNKPTNSYKLVSCPTGHNVIREANFNRRVVREK